MENWYTHVTNNATVANIICLLGAATSLYLLVNLALHLYAFLRPSSLSRYLHKGKESWALVTGSSDGIGLGFAQELCKNGFNVILHGRNRQKLQGVKERLKGEFPSVKIRILVIDATAPTDSLEDIVVRELADIHLTVLINNVGGQPYHIARTFQRLQDFANLEVDRALNLNARFPIQLTRVLLPILEGNGPSLIMNISSLAAIGAPYLCVYVGSKGFIEAFTRGLKTEIRAEAENVEVIGIRTGNVLSGSNKVRTSFFTPTSRVMARAALARVGCGQTLIAAYWPHWLQLVPFNIFPEKIIQTWLIQELKLRKKNADLEKDHEE
jgi:short-subunit dehydrogenase